MPAMQATFLQISREPVLGCFSSDFGGLGLGGEGEGVGRKRTTGNCHSTIGNCT